MLIPEQLPEVVKLVVAVNVNTFADVLVITNIPSKAVPEEGEK
jgi:hypothetical protein